MHIYYRTCISIKGGSHRPRAAGQRHQRGRAGGSAIDSKVVENLIAPRTRQARSPLADLPPRETEVLAEVAQGKNNAAIASNLHLTERAVEKHINSIFSKLGLGEEEAVHRRVRATLIYLAARAPEKR